MGLSLLVTVGSTLFSDLTDLVVSPTFLQLATRLGLTDIVVQYGAADLTFPPDAKHITIGIVGKARSEAGKGSGEGSFEYTAGTHEASGRPMNALVDGPEQEIVQGPIRVRYMRYTSEFDEEVKRADMVISHAGMSPYSGELQHPQLRRSSVCYSPGFRGDLIVLTSRFRIHLVRAESQQTLAGTT